MVGVPLELAEAAGEKLACADAVGRAVGDCAALVAAEREAEPVARAL